VQLERLKAQFESEKFKDELKEISKYLDDSFGISFSDVFRGQGKKTEEEFIKILLERVEKSIEEVRQSI
jgi:translation initiation factor IF-3